MRIIDADALIERLDDFNKWCKDQRLQGSLFAVDVVGDMPTVDVLDKIIPAIAGIEITGHIDEHTSFIRTGDSVKKIALDIIDKYR